MKTNRTNIYLYHACFSARDRTGTISLLTVLIRRQKKAAGKICKKHGHAQRNISVCADEANTAPRAGAVHGPTIRPEDALMGNTETYPFALSFGIPPVQYLRRLKGENIKHGQSH
jgi:hypothetical protein